MFIRYSRVCNQDALIGKRKYLLLSLKNLFIFSCEILRIKGWTSLPRMINRKFIFYLSSLWFTIAWKENQTKLRRHHHPGSTVLWKTETAHKQMCVLIRYFPVTEKWLFPVLPHYNFLTKESFSRYIVCLI